MQTTSAPKEKVSQRVDISVEADKNIDKIKGRLALKEQKMTKKAILEMIIEKYSPMELASL